MAVLLLTSSWRAGNSDGSESSDSSESSESRDSSDSSDSSDSNDSSDTRDGPGKSLQTSARGVFLDDQFPLKNM